MNARIIPAIAPTENQWKLLDALNNPYVKSAKSGVIKAYEIVDDNHVALYTVQPNGNFIVETLLNGFNNGWTTLDEEGYQIEEEDGEFVRVSDSPEEGWSD